MSSTIIGLNVTVLFMYHFLHITLEFICFCHQNGLFEGRCMVRILLAVLHFLGILGVVVNRIITFSKRGSVMASISNL